MIKNKISYTIKYSSYVFKIHNRILLKKFVKILTFFFVFLRVYKNKYWDFLNFDLFKVQTKFDLEFSIKNYEVLYPTLPSKFKN